MSDQPGGGAPPPAGQPPQAPPPQAPPPQAPPPQNWQSTPQPPGPPPAGGGQPSGMPSWTAGLTDQRPVAGPAGLFYADVPNRAIAMFIDVVAMVIIQFILIAIANGILGTNLGFVTVPSTASLLVGNLLAFAVWAAYFIYTWVALRGTVGMKVLGMQIGHESDGRTLTYQQAAVRFGVLFGPQIVLGLLGAIVPALSVLGLLSFVWLIFVLVTMAQSPTKQGIHDRYARSMVVKAGRSMLQPPS
ncbi:MAG TPA: RDD family protein [Candidatus Limnocylindrales bacterium]|nr:RDD family protein [Candidatus Limnocylindrales bacterium]